LFAFLQLFLGSVFVPPLQHGQTSSWKGLHVSMTGRAVFLTLPLPRDCIIFSQFKSRLLLCGVLEIAAFPFCELWSFILNVKLQLVVFVCIAKDPVTNFYTSTRILAENSFKAIAAVDLTIQHGEHLCRWPSDRQVRHLDNPLWTIRISCCFIGRCFLQAPNNVVFILCEEVCLHTGLFEKASHWREQLWVARSLSMVLNHVPCHARLGIFNWYVYHGVVSLLVTPKMIPISQRPLPLNEDETRA